MKTGRRLLWSLKSGTGSCIFLVGIWLFAGCKERFTPNIHVPAQGFLVVEGFINAGNGPTRISLSRSTSLDAPQIIPETGAAMEVQSESGASFPLSEIGGGAYSVDQLNLDPAQKYRLHIKTSNNLEYQSDLSEVKLSPPVDSVNWTTGTDAVSLFVSTHDPLQQTLYYQWDFTETWKYYSKYTSGYIFNNKVLEVRPLDQLLPFTCYRSDSSTAIIIASTEKLKSDVIFEFPLTSVPYLTTDKLVVKYSINVRQLALTKDWYEWKLKLQRNTESLGSIFDAQPSGTGGNFHCLTNPDENVVGFVGCTSVSEKRIFITREQVMTPRIFTGYEDCYETSVKNNKDSLSGFYSYPSTITNVVMSAGGAVDRILFSGAECVDCRLHGGTDTIPDFWQ